MNAGAAPIENSNRSCRMTHKGQPGCRGLSKSKPTWRNTFGFSAASAFSFRLWVVLGGCGHEGSHRLVTQPECDPERPGFANEPPVLVTRSRPRPAARSQTIERGTS